MNGELTYKKIDFLIYKFPQSSKSVRDDNFIFVDAASLKNLIPLPLIQAPPPFPSSVNLNFSRI